MFCPQCGKSCPDDSRFCEHCGSLIEAAPASGGPRGDHLSAAVSEIEANVRRTQAVPSPAPVFVPAAPPVQMQRKSHAGLIIALVMVFLLLAAAGGGAFYVFHLRSANEAALSENLMDHMWERCEEEIIDYYDDALPEPYSERGYKIDRKASAFSLRPTAEKDVVAVSGRVDIIDRTVDDASYEVEIEGTAKMDFMRQKLTDWDLEYHFEEPPVREAEDEPDDKPEAEDDSQQEPAPEVQPGESAGVPGSGSADPQSMYLWPTDTQYITSDDLDGFARKEIMLMRNELYARHGCSFQDEEIRTYFEAQSWYDPDPDLLAIDFKREWFNEYETANLDTILNYERAMGWKK